jgi:hypothetical protein
MPAIVLDQPEDYASILLTISQHYKAPPDGCCAGKLCEYSQAPPPHIEPSEHFTCLCCGGQMHSDRYCGETVATILGGKSAWLWEYLPEPAIKVFQGALTAEVGDERPEEPVPSERIWRKLEDELVCHSCFADYIDVVKAHPPRNVKASLSDCTTLMGDGFAGAGVADPVLKEAGVEEEDEGEGNNGEEEDNGGEEDSVGSAALQPHQRPPWHHLNDWRHLHLFELHQLDARSWLSHLNGDVYGPKVWPMILIVMTIGIPQIGNSEFKLFSCLMDINMLYSPN